jgi:hypothetical protein
MVGDSNSESRIKAALNREPYDLAVISCDGHGILTDETARVIRRNLPAFLVKCVDEATETVAKRAGGL